MATEKNIIPFVRFWASDKTIDNSVIKIRDIAVVKESFEPSISAASINGNPGVYLSVQGQLNADTYKLTQELESALTLIEPLLSDKNIEIIPKKNNSISTFHCNRISV